MRGFSLRARAWSVILGLALLNAFNATAVPPRILGFLPRTEYVGEHQTYWFYVYAVGNHRLAYHWWHQEPDSTVGHEIPREGGLIIGRPRLTVFNALNSRDYNGWYWCVVEDTVTGERTMSPRGRLIVLLPPVITQQPASVTVARGNPARFTVSANAGAPVPLRYQWFFGTQMIPGAIGRTLLIPFVTARNGGSYTCRVTTRGGSKETSGALLTVTQ